jgi:hypothetical protein
MNVLLLFGVAIVLLLAAGWFALRMAGFAAAARRRHQAARASLRVLRRPFSAR